MTVFISCFYAALGDYQGYSLHQPAACKIFRHQSNCWVAGPSSRAVLVVFQVQNIRFSAPKYRGYGTQIGNDKSFEAKSISCLARTWATKVIFTITMNNFQISLERLVKLNIATRKELLEGISVLLAIATNQIRASCLGCLFAYRPMFQGTPYDLTRLLNLDGLANSRKHRTFL